MVTLPLFEPDYKISSQFSPHDQIIIHQGDVNELLPTLPDGAVDLIVTSPPYNLGKAYERRVSIEEYLAQQSETIAELVRTLRDGGSVCWQVGNYVEDGEVYPLDIFYYGMFKSLGLSLRNRIIWHFGHGLHTSKRFSGRYETILWFSKGTEYTFNLDPVRVPAKYPGKRHYKGPNLGKPSGNPRGKNPSDVWDILIEEWNEALWDIPNVKSNHPEKTVHPCQFPVELVERCVLALTHEGDLVFDPYAGVGSSIIAAIKNDRRALASEKEQAYVDIARERVASYYRGDLKLRPLGRPVFEPTGNEKIARPPAEWEDAK